MIQLSADAVVLVDQLARHLDKTPTRITYGVDATCIVCCGQDRHMPPLRESPQTRAIASLLVERIRMAHRTGSNVLRWDGKVFRGYMLGVLKLGGSLHIAISGSVLPPDLENVINAAGYGTFVHSVPPHTTAGGARIDDVYMAKFDGQSPAEPFMCAAPKLVAKAREDIRGQTWSMTEMWCGPATRIREPGHAYWSCSNCVDILPMMLCLRKPVALEQRGGYKLVVGKHGKKEAAAGRSPVRK